MEQTLVTFEVGNYGEQLETKQFKKILDQNGFSVFQQLEGGKECACCFYITNFTNYNIYCNTATDTVYGLNDIIDLLEEYEIIKRIDARAYLLKNNVMKLDNKAPYSVTELLHPATKALIRSMGQTRRFEMID